MKQFFNSPVGHGIVAFFLMAGAFGVAHLGTYGDMTISALLIGLLKWITAETTS